MDKIFGVILIIVCIGLIIKCSSSEKEIDVSTTVLEKTKAIDSDATVTTWEAVDSKFRDTTYIKIN